MQCYRSAYGSVTYIDKIKYPKAYYIFDEFESDPTPDKGVSIVRSLIEVDACPPPESCEISMYILQIDEGYKVVIVNNLLILMLGPEKAVQTCIKNTEGKNECLINADQFIKNYYEHIDDDINIVDMSPETGEIEIDEEEDCDDEWDDDEDLSDSAFNEFLDTLDEFFSALIGAAVEKQEENKKISQNMQKIRFLNETDSGFVYEVTGGEIADYIAHLKGMYEYRGKTYAQMDTNLNEFLKPGDPNAIKGRRIGNTVLIGK